VLKRLVNLMVSLLVPALLVAGAADGAYALFECSMTNTLQTHCCCAAKAASEDEPCGPQVKRADCCSERWFSAKAPVPGHQSQPATPLVLAQSYERVLVRELYRAQSAPLSFAVREAPRAIGPPLIYLYRVLRL
jgi:hypothetical protein